MTSEGGNNDIGVVFSLPLNSALIVTSPNGGENWTVGSNHSIIWTSTGAIANVNIDYSTDGGINWTSIATNTVNDGLHMWDVPSTPATTCLLRISEAAEGNPLDISDAMFTILAEGVESISAPNTPSGPTIGTISTSYDYSTGGSTTSMGDPVQYKLDWDDGSTSGWLTAGVTTASHGWAAAGTYHVRAMARCATHTAVESLWSPTLAVIIFNEEPSGMYNSPAQYKVLPEVIWASATGGGTWVSEVQLTDVTGGSQVSVYYNTLLGRRGPFPAVEQQRRGAQQHPVYQPAADHRRVGCRHVHLLRDGGGGGVRHPGRQPPAACGGTGAEWQLREIFCGIVIMQF